MKPNQTLYLIQSTFAHTDAILNTLEQIHAMHDAIVLMGDAVLFSADQRLEHLENIYILINDAELLVSKLPPHIQLINYIQFADLVLNFTRSVSLK
ncbi:DsrH/TusB family sulfur metabolism protein [Acinetobacter sp. ANC 4648]|uniref:DsrH/TusB family sulfur metabolism protein n=1 Tax=Acinetobacter sp. ANC 4648 TaxID=1977875 RepID=UPI000A32B73F|nr:DsrH/TusB family sulfur metabolism protein [Acinetobacter sp. ANC 4648]OTG82185.1 hypothetical protein B9T27_07995 [Acinetobacter sp. ANC 4648]